MTLTKFIRTSVAALGALAVASQAQAADIYSGGGMKEPPMYAPPPTWTGFYLGLNMGADWSSINMNWMRFDDDYFYTPGWGFWNGYQPGYFNAKGLGDVGGFGGGQFGYNFGGCGGCSFVYGIEVDLGGMAIVGHENMRTATGYTNPITGQYTFGTPAMMDMNNNGGFYGDVTGRLGYGWNNVLVYAKGGFAWLNYNLQMRESFFRPDMYAAGVAGCGASGWCDYGNNNNNSYVTGWTVGGGIEWKVSPSWSIKAEYLHFDFSNNNNNCCNDYFYTTYGWNNYRNNADLTVDSVKLGFNYYFNPVSAPMPLK